MKKIIYIFFLLLSLSAFSQNYEKQWKEVSELESKGSYKSLKTKVDKIYKSAEKDKNDNQKIKAFLYQMKVDNVLNETNYQKKAERLKSELSKSTGIYKAIFRWYYIKTLINAYDSKYNYSRIHSEIKTNTTDLPKNIDLWTQKQFLGVLLEQTNLLFEEEALLKKTPISKIEALVEYDLIDHNLNQSIYDFIAINYINEFSNYRNVRVFFQDSFNQFDATFVNSKIIIPPFENSTELKNELQKQAILLLQKLEKQYLESNQEQLLDKIRFVRFENLSNDLSAESKTFQDLGKNLKSDYFKNRWKSMYAHKLYQEINKENYTDYSEKTFKAIDEVKQDKTENNQLRAIKNLEDKINSKEYSISLKGEVYENEPVKYLVNYKNIDTLNLAYYDFSKYKTLNDSIYKLIIENDKPIQKVSRFLNQEYPLFLNSTEILGEQLPLGTYLLVAYANKNDLNAFDTKRTQIFKTTNIMLLTKNIDDYNSAVFVVNPKNGKPYENKVARYNHKKYITDSTGKIIVPNSKDYYDNNEFVIFVNKEIYRKTLYLDSYGQSISKKNIKRDAALDLFTDRSIYRPGQEVHFKGILYEMNPEQNQVLANKNFLVILEDDNGTEIEEKIVKTNEWGAFSGTFILPKTIRTGDFSIKIDELDKYTNQEEKDFWNELDFPSKTFDYRVEEYKRPTYTLEVEDITKNVFFDEQVTLNGKATSLAGGAIANAKINLNIDASYYNSEKNTSVKILDINETIFTDNYGKFQYTLVVSSDSLSKNIKSKIISISVDYEIEIIDQSGEVKEHQSSFYVSNAATKISAYSTSGFKTNELLKVIINSNTQNGDFFPVTGTIKIYQTLPNKNFYEKRNWQEPTLKSIDELTFKNLFPKETYDLADSKISEKSLIYEGSYTTEKDKAFELNINDWKTGSYELVFEIVDSKAKLPIKAKTNISIKNKEEKLATNENFAIITHPKSTASNLFLEVQSIYDDVHLFIEYFDKDATIKATVFPIKKGTQIVRIPLTPSNENDNISYQWFFVNNQNMYSGNGNFDFKKELPKTENKWNAEWQVWNNKLNPAQQYQWKLILKDEKTNKPFQGEFLASMYDASLDMLLKSFWKTYADKISNYTYVNFSNPKTLKTVVVNNLYEYRNAPFNDKLYWNSWNYLGYNFTPSAHYNRYYDKKTQTGLHNRYYQVEVRDKKTDKFIANARVHDFKTDANSITNEDGFTRVLGDKNSLIGISAVGYKEKRIKLINEFTVIFLENDNELISNASFDNYNKINEEWERISSLYNQLKRFPAHAKISKDEFIDLLKQYDDVNQSFYELNESELFYDEDDATFNDLENLIIDTYRSTSKPKSSVAASVVSSKEIEGRPNASFIQTLQAQVPGLNITVGEPAPENTHKEIALRKNLSETAFFLPHLQVNKNGEVIFDFVAPESLTEWKFRGLAHNKKTDYVYIEALSKTQKDVMIQPNMPRFVRETDEIEIKARVSNTTDKAMKATALLRLFNTITGEDLTSEIIKTTALVPVNIESFSANSVGWKVKIPKEVVGLQYRISVQSGNFTDGEESVIPVLNNRQLVTETLPVWQLSNENKTYELTNLVENTSKTLENHQLRIDISNNVTWLMMQSFPYLLDYPYDCSEQLFAKYFAASIASHIVEENASIKKLVDEWKANPLSKLEENEGLKQTLLQETPWFKDLISDDEKKAQFASNFDAIRLKEIKERIENVLIERQLPSGALPWFSDGSENPYITWQVLVTVAQLKNIGIKNAFLEDKSPFVNKAQRYLDIRFENQFKDKRQASFSEVIDYALMKGYYKDSFGVTVENQQRLDMRLDDLRLKWLDLSLYEKAKLIIVLERKGETKWAKEIINQLEESAVLDETYGMYWRSNSSQYYYYYNSAEVQAMIIEAYKTMKMPADKIQRLNAYLLSQKNQTDWGTTKSTTQSLYALILGQNERSMHTGTIQLKVGKEKKNVSKDIKSVNEESIGIFTYNWLGNDVKADMGKIEIKNTTPTPIFGGIYWQYFEDMAKIKNAPDGILSISRGYYTENYEGKWDVVTDSTKLTLGQKVRVRIEFEATKKMSYLHIKDNRPSTFEPLDVLSGYRYGNRLGYYQSTRDAATNFFIDYLSPGKYVLEYDVRLNNIGDFTSGISTIQSMYAPEHSSHTAGDKVRVE